MLKEIIQETKKIRSIAVIAFIILMISNLSYYLFSDKYYQSNASYRVVENSVVGTGTSLLPSSALSLLGSSSGSNDFLSLEILSSKKLFKKFYDDKKYLTDIYASVDYYDGELIYDSSRLLEGIILTDYVPNFEDAHKDFKEDILTFKLNSRTGFIEIISLTKSPDLSKALIDRVVDEANSIYLSTEINSSLEAFKNIEDVLLKNKNVSIAAKNAVSKILETEVQNQIMLAKDTKPLLKEIDPPYAEFKNKIPNSSFFIISFLLSILTLVLIIFSRYFFKIFAENKD